MGSIVDTLVQFCTDVISTFGLPGVFVLMVLESACIPVPSEAIMLYGGFLVASQGDNLYLMILAGVGGNLVGSWIAWWVGMTKGRDWALRWRKPRARMGVSERSGLDLSPKTAARYAGGSAPVAFPVAS